MRVLTALDAFANAAFVYVLDDGVPDQDGLRLPESPDPKAFSSN